MNGDPVVLGVGVVDATRLVGTAEIDLTWRELGVDAPGDGRTMRVVFGKTDSTYRRLDRLSRSLVLAAEAAGLDRVLSDEQRNEAALLAESRVGCVEIDRRYTRSLAGDVVEAAIFPYTLPSTSLGEVALRSGLRGPTISLSVEPERSGASLREARRLFSAGEVRHVVAASVDVLDESARGLPRSLCAVVAVLAGPDCGQAGAVAWPGDTDDPFGRLARGISS